MYTLVYSKEEKLYISIDLPTLSLIKELELMEEGPMVVRLVELIELEELRKQTLLNLESHQAWMKKTFDKRASLRVYEVGDLVLK